MIERGVLTSLLALVVSCGEPTQKTGEIGAACYPNGTCNVGLSCSAGVCYPADAPSPTDASVDSPLDGPPDAPPDAPFVCHNDNAFEPNETLQTAFATGVQTTQTSVTYNNLAICPSGDADHYLVAITAANTNFEALLYQEPSAVQPLRMAILGSGGATLNNATLRSQPLTVTFDTSPAGGIYSPQNCVVVWVESAGTFVKTIGRWCDVRKQYLLAWTSKAGPNDPDAISGATRAGHSTRLTATWDLKNNFNTIVPDGTYSIRMETTDGLASGVGDNNQGTFTFTKGPADQIQTGLGGGGHSNVNIAYSPSRVMRAYVANLPVGNYYVWVSAAAGEENYRLTVNTGP